MRDDEDPARLEAITDLPQRMQALHPVEEMQGKQAHRAVEWPHRRLVHGSQQKRGPIGMRRHRLPKSNVGKILRKELRA